MGVGPSELLIVLVIVLVLFGGSRLPGLARSLGQAQAEFRKGAAQGARSADAAPVEQARPEDTSSTS
jgi:sec-independent protein translocase protein TatA